MKNLEKHKLNSEELPFTDRYKTELTEIFRIIGLQECDFSDIDKVVELTQPLARGDHHDPAVQIELEEASIAAIENTAWSLGMVAEVKPQGGAYEQILILGGEQKSNQERINYALSLLTDHKSLSVDSLVTLGGVRGITLREVPALAQDLEKVTNSNSSWLRYLLKKEKLTSFTEDDALRLALLAKIGHMDLASAHLRLNNSELYSHMVFRGSASLPRIVTINAQAVDRPLGDRRHTTESTLNEWLDLFPPSSHGRVLLVSNNPYIPRNARNLKRIIEQNRPDIEIDTCGPQAVKDGTLWRRILGEIARNIYEDLNVTK